MTPKEKAEELLDKMKYPMDGVYIISHIANELALISVDEVIEALHEHHWQNRLIIDYWQEVKNELEKL
jgi:hypothetical protein